LQRELQDLDTVKDAVNEKESAEDDDTVREDR
jgi:hypothetical protein